MNADWLSGGFTIDANISEPGDTVYGNYQDPVTPHLDNIAIQQEDFIIKLTL